MSAVLSVMNGKRPSQRAQEGVDSIYPVIPTGKPHHMTRHKQRIAWQLGYLKGFEEARRMILNKHIGETIDDDAQTEESS